MFIITPSHIIEYLYCPRFTYFEYTLRIPQFEEKNFKVMQGRTMHELKSLQNKDYLRQRRLPLWVREDPRRKALVARRCRTVEEVAAWVREQHGLDGLHGLHGRPQTTAQAMKSIQSIKSIASIPSTYPEIAANAAHVLIGVACALLDRQLTSLARSFEAEGGFTERLYRVRSGRR